MRFMARLVSGSIEDQSKSFILSYFLEDDTLSIYMASFKNSGVQQGKFLERNRYKNANRGNEYFLLKDFQLGSVLEINKHIFQILSADEFTLKFTAERPELELMTDSNQVLLKIKQKCDQDNSHIAFIE